MQIGHAGSDPWAEGEFGLRYADILDTWSCPCGSTYAMFIGIANRVL